MNQLIKPKVHLKISYYLTVSENFRLKKKMPLNIFFLPFYKILNLNREMLPHRIKLYTNVRQVAERYNGRKNINTKEGDFQL